MRLLVLPGFDGTANFLADFKGYLPDGVACEFIAFPSSEVLGYEGLANLINRKLPAEDFILVGQSFSGPLSVMVAQSRPKYLKGLVLVGTFGVRPLPLSLSLISRTILNTVGKIDLPAQVLNGLLLNDKAASIAEEIRSIIKHLPKRVFMKRGFEALEVDVLLHLKKVPVPVLVLEAGQDRLLRRGTSVELSQNCSNGILKVLDGPHLLLQQSPQETALAIYNFANSLS